MDQPDYGSFTEYFKGEAESVFIAIHPEMHPAKPGIKPSGRYFIYCIYPDHGSCIFILDQDDQCAWISDYHPPFIDRALITWIGERIERNDKE